MDDDGIIMELFKADVHVYQPSRDSSKGHKAQTWPQPAIWSGKLTISDKTRHDKAEECLIELHDGTSGDLFAVCPYVNERVVEPALDSSRYFVIRVVDGARHAWLGIGFDTKEDAFDFKVTLADYHRRDALIHRKATPQTTTTTTPVEAKKPEEVPEQLLVALLPPPPSSSATPSNDPWTVEDSSQDDWGDFQE